MVMEPLLFQQYAAQYFALENRRSTLLRDTRGLLRLIRATRSVRPGPLGHAIGSTHAARSPWLDLGCGSGEHVAVLRRAGLNVGGIDRSAAMIGVARERFPGLPVRAAAIEALPDADSPRLSLAGAFSLFGTFNYYQSRSELRNALRAVSAALRPGGRLILEMWQRDSYAALLERSGQDLADGAGLLATQREQRIAPRNGGELVRQRTVRVLAGAPEDPPRFAEIEPTYSGASQANTDVHRLRLSDPDELTQIAGELGLRLCADVAADLSGQPLARASAGMLLVFAKDAGNVGGQG